MPMTALLSLTAATAGRKVAAGPWIRRGCAVLAACGLAALAGAVHSAEPSVEPAGTPPSTPASANSGPGVVVVLSGGAAKGFAHLAVLQQLEQDRVPIKAIVGTSVGAVIGGLYASGLGAEKIHAIISRLDPSRVALDQNDRRELTGRARDEQLRYPLGIEIGIKDGELRVARGLSDGQRFTALLQRELQHLPPELDFARLPIPFLTVATRFRDGEATVLSRGNLILAIRASMAAPAVFAPVEIDGETYVDGGLVANLPVELALQHHGSLPMVVSFLGESSHEPESRDASALSIANQMLSILIRQNERRNLRLLRPQDVLVAPRLEDIGFSDFHLAEQARQRGVQAVRDAAPAWAAMVQRARPVAPAAVAGDVPRAANATVEAPVGRRVVAVELEGNENVPARSVIKALQVLVGHDFDAATAERVIDALYTEGDFERIVYRLHPVGDGRYALRVQVRERPVGVNRFKATIGMALEQHGTQQFAVGLGYRHPWLTQHGLAFEADARVGTQSALGLRLVQPMGRSVWLEAGVEAEVNSLPLYADERGHQKEGYLGLRNRNLFVRVAYEWQRKLDLQLGLTRRVLALQAETPLPGLDDEGRFGFHLESTNLRLQGRIDQLDSASFPTEGYFLQASHEQGLGTLAYRSQRVDGRWAGSAGRHVAGVGLQWSRDDSDCPLLCTMSSSQFLGGFQRMGAYRLGQLASEHVLHLQATYMFRLSDGGLLRQRAFAGLVLERARLGALPDAPGGDQFYSSSTLFIAMDSRLGDLYLGMARGSRGARNVFVQLGRRFGM